MTLRYCTKNGFTLIETVIILALSVCMLIAFSLLIYNFNTMSSYEQIAAQSSGSATAVMREIESLTLPAKNVLQTHTFSNGTYTSTTTSLVLEIPSIDGSGNVITNTYDYAAFYVVGTTSAYRLLEKHASSARVPGTKLLSSTVSSLTFSFNNVDFTKVSTTTVDIQTQAYVKQDVIADHRREQIRLRNH